MADYTETFTKVTGNTIEVTDFQTEFQAIETAVATKLDVDGDTATNFTIGAGYSGGAIQQETVTATTSGGSASYTGIPSWCKKITFMCSLVSCDAVCDYWIRIGDAGGLEANGYSSTLGVVSATPSSQNYTAAFVVASLSGATHRINGSIILTNLDGNIWACQGNLADDVGTTMHVSGGRKELTATLDRVSLQVSTGSFDGGSVNILYEG